MKAVHNYLLLLMAVSSFGVHQSSAAADRVDEGKKLYHAICSMCHGAELKAAGGIPDLRVARLDDQAFLSVVREGRPGTIMPPMKSRLSDEEIRMIRAYVRTSASD